MERGIQKCRKRKQSDQTKNWGGMRRKEKKINVQEIINYWTVVCVMDIKY